MSELDWVGLEKELRHALRNLHKTQAIAFEHLRSERRHLDGRKSVKYLAQITITIDVIALLFILQLVRLYVLPERFDDLWPRLSVNAQKTCQLRVQFVLHRLMLEEKKNFALHVFIASALHLKTVCLVTLTATVPLEQWKKSKKKCSEFSLPRPDADRDRIVPGRAQ